MQYRPNNESEFYPPQRIYITPNLYFLFLLLSDQDAVKLIPQPGLNDSISTIAVSDSPTKTYETKECQTEPESELPVNHLLPFLFPVVCDESTHLSASAPLSPPSRYSFSYPTAEESLEKYMEYASEYHKKSADFFTSRVATGM